MLPPPPPSEHLDSISHQHDSRMNELANDNDMASSAAAVEAPNDGPADGGDDSGQGGPIRLTESLCLLEDGQSVLFCGNDTSSCYYATADCNGVSDCPNGHDESVHNCGESNTLR